MLSFSLLRSTGILAVAGGILCACAGPERSPFALWELRAGMPLAELDSISLHSQKQRMTCARSYGSFKTCSIQSLGAFGTVFAVVDSTAHAVLVGWRPNLEGILLYPDMRVGFEIETRRLRAHWNTVAPPHPDPSQRLPERAESWSTRDGRWSARLSWRRDGYPSEFRVADDRAMATWRMLEARAHADSITRLASAPVAVIAADRPPAFRGSAELGVEAAGRRPGRVSRRASRLR